MKRTLLSVLAVVVAACSPTAVELRPDPRLEFAYGPDFREYLSPTPQLLATPGNGQITVAAMMTEPHGCEDFEAALSSGDQTLELTVSIFPTRTFKSCTGLAANFMYTAQLKELEDGTYRLRVRHTYPESDRPDRVVLDRTITVATLQAL